MEISSYPQESFALSERIIFSISCAVDVTVYRWIIFRIVLGHKKLKIIVIGVGGVIVCVIIIYLIVHSVSCC